MPEIFFNTQRQRNARQGMVYAQKEIQESDKQAQEIEGYIKKGALVTKVAIGIASLYYLGKYFDYLGDAVNAHQAYQQVAETTDQWLYHFMQAGGEDAVGDLITQTTAFVATNFGVNYITNLIASQAGKMIE